MALTPWRTLWLGDMAVSFFGDRDVSVRNIWFSFGSRFHGTLHLCVPSPGRAAQHSAGRCTKVHGSVLVWRRPGQYFHGAAGITTGSSSGSPPPPRKEESRHLSEEKTQNTEAVYRQLFPLNLNSPPMKTQLSLANGFGVLQICLTRRDRGRCAALACLENVQIQTNDMLSFLCPVPNAMPFDGYEAERQ